MSPLEQTSALRTTLEHVLHFDSMYDRMIERLYLTSSTRYIPRYTLEAARLRHWVQTHQNENDLNGALEE